MKNTPNVTFAFKVDNKNATTASLLNLCLAHPPAGGFDFAIMRSRNRVADVCDKVKAGGEIKLDDADHVTAVEAVKNMKWGISNKELLKFGELFGQ